MGTRSLPQTNVSSIQFQHCSSRVFSAYNGTVHEETSLIWDREFLLFWLSLMCMCSKLDGDFSVDGSKVVHQPTILMVPCVLYDS